MKTINNIKVVIYNPSEKEELIVKKILSTIKVKTITYSNEDELGAILTELENSAYKSKEVLLIKKFMGRFFQICPGTPEMICCNYRLINTGFNCLYNCAYCYLQIYLNSFGILQFSNMGQVLKELDDFIETMDPNKIYRIGTGEYTDSLMMDNITGISEMLIEKLAKYPNIMLELKSKSDNIDHLINIPNKGNCVIAWSLNTPKNIQDYEEDTASLEKRLEAAKKISDAGYFLAFHFDPIIIYENWQKDYSELLEKLFAVVNKDKVAWISLGGFRYTPDFKEVLNDNFPDQRMTLEEMFPSIDGKYRYFKKNRFAIYSFMKDEIAKYTDVPFVYMCMESADAWLQVFGKEYSSSEELEDDIAEYLKNRFFT